MRTLLVLLSPLLLSPTGCALFASGAIEETCDDLPGCGGAASETGALGGDDTGTAGTDQGGDDTAPVTGDDTAPVAGDTGTTSTTPEPSVGVIMMGYDAAAGSLGFWVYSPEDTQLGSVSIGPVSDESPYQVAWDPDKETIYVAWGDQVRVLDLAEAEVKGIVDAPDLAVSLAVVGADLWIVNQTSLGVIRGGTLSYEDVETLGTFTETSGGFYNPASDALKIVDLDRASPDLWDYALASSTLSQSLINFDDQEARARLPFLGADGQSWSCTSVGAVHDLRELSVNENEPLRMLDASVSDIKGCGYDPGSDEVIMFSKSLGALRVAADGSYTARPIAAEFELRAASTW